jgi:hypothetical protein
MYRLVIRLSIHLIHNKCLMLDPASVYPNGTRLMLNHSTIGSCLINRCTRSARDGSPWSSGKAKPENPIQVGLWRPTNLSTIDTC